MTTPIVQKRVDQNVQHLWRFLASFIDQYGWPPNHREITEGMGFKTISMVNFYLQKLAARKIIEFTPHTPRGIRLLKRPGKLVVQPTGTPMSPEVQALDQQAKAFASGDVLLIWHGNPHTGAYTGFEVVGRNGITTVVGDVGQPSAEIERLALS